jgi:hypothetical protein
MDFVLHTRLSRRILALFEKHREVMTMVTGFFAVFLFFSLYVFFASAATRTWTGAVDNNWSNAGNWDGGKPGTGDIAKFDSTCTRCDVTIDENVSVGGILLDGTYTGTTTQSGSYTVTVGSLGFSVAAGTFQGGSSSITTQTFTLSGGTFTAPSGTMTVGYTVTSNNTTLFSYTGGSFNANGGTIVFTNGPFGGYLTHYINLTQSITFNTFILNKVEGYDGYYGQYRQQALNLNGTGSMTATSFIQTDGVMNASLTVTGNVTIQANADGGSGTLLMNGSANGTYTQTSGGTGPGITIQKPSGYSVSFGAGTTNVRLGVFSLVSSDNPIAPPGNFTSTTFSQSGGTFTAPSGTMTVGYFNNSTVGVSVFSYTAGTFNANGGKVVFSEGSFNLNTNYCTPTTNSITIQQAISFYQVDFSLKTEGFIYWYNGWSFSCPYSGYLQKTGSGTMTVTNAFTHTNGVFVAGTIQVEGDITIASGADGGSGTLLLNGSTNQTYTKYTGGTNPSGLTLDKPSGTFSLVASSTMAFGAVTLASTNAVTLSQGNITMTMTSLTLSGGTYEQGSAPLTTTTMTFPAGSTALFNQRGSTITVNGAYSQAAGSFQGGWGNITVQTFSQTGGVFTSTSRTMTVSSGQAGATAFRKSGGTFNANNGTLILMFLNNSGSMETNQALELSSPITFSSVVIGGGAGYGGAGPVIVSFFGAANVSGSFTYGKTSPWGSTITMNGGTWNMSGDNVIFQSAGNGGNSVFRMIGANNSTYTYEGGIGLYLKIEKDSQKITVKPASGTTSLSISFFNLSQGTFFAPSGTMTINSYSHNGPTTPVSYTGGTFNHNGGTLFLYLVYYYNNTGTINLSLPLRLNNLTIQTIGLHNGNSTTFFSGSGSLTVGGVLTLRDGILSGNALLAEGNIVVESGADGGTGTLTFSGSKNQTYTDQGGDEPNGAITINKPSGTVSLASNADWNASGQTVTITSGVLDQGASYNLSTGGTLTVGTGGVWRNVGTGDISLGGNVVNNGQVQFRGSTPCGGSDQIAITSTSGQRLWSGSGKSTISDVSVTNQGGTATIYANSSTNVSGNGTNWLFTRNDCSAPDASLENGTLHWLGGTFNIR